MRVSPSTYSIGATFCTFVSSGKGTKLCRIVVWNKICFCALLNEVIHPQTECVNKSVYDENFAMLVKMVSLGFGGLIVDMMLQCL